MYRDELLHQFLPFIESEDADMHGLERNVLEAQRNSVEDIRRAINVSTPRVMPRIPKLPILVLEGTNQREFSGIGDFGMRSFVNLSPIRFSVTGDLRLLIDGEVTDGRNRIVMQLDDSIATTRDFDYDYNYDGDKFEVVDDQLRPVFQVFFRHETMVMYYAVYCHAKGVGADLVVASKRGFEFGATTTMDGARGAIERIFEYPSTRNPGVVRDSWKPE